MSSPQCAYLGRSLASVPKTSAIPYSETMPNHRTQHHLPSRGKAVHLDLADTTADRMVYLQTL